MSTNTDGRFAPLATSQGRPPSGRSFSSPMLPQGTPQHNHVIVRQSRWRARRDGGCKCGWRRGVPEADCTAGAGDGRVEDFAGEELACRVELQQRPGHRVARALTHFVPRGQQRHQGCRLAARALRAFRIRIRPSGPLPIRIQPLRQILQPLRQNQLHRLAHCIPRASPQPYHATLPTPPPPLSHPTRTRRLTASRRRRATVFPAPALPGCGWLVPGQSSESGSFFDGLFLAVSIRFLT